MSTTTKITPTHKGPWTHRAMVAAFTVLFGLLFYWMLGFVVKDIGSWPGPDWQRLQSEMLEPGLRENLEQLNRQIQDTTRDIQAAKDRQLVLRDSTDNSERTMNRLLELHRLSLQMGVKPTEPEQQALAESEQLFLKNQDQYQQINEQVARLSEQLRTLEAQQRDADRLLRERSQPVNEEYQRRQSRHRLTLAAVKLAILIPLLAGGVWLFIRRRGGLYAPLIYAFGLATTAKVLMVMHEHFPRRYFKYFLILAALALVARILVYLLRMIAQPKADWLLKQYREAYERFLCPICAFPIRRGPWKHLFWNRRTIRKLQPRLGTEASPTEEKPYSCPVCGTRLFEECPSCHQIRHSLLPVCSACGTESPIGLAESAPSSATADAPAAAPVDKPAKRRGRS